MSSATTTTTTTPTTATTTTTGVLCRDRFDDDRAAGAVVGSIGSDGARRLGVDVEGLVGIDGGALRLRPLQQPGWGREGIAYGPFEPTPGLAFAAHVLNGHNASQTFYFPETARQFVRRALGDARRGRFRRPRHHENLAVGFLARPDVAQPLAGGHAFVMHAATADNGELWTAFRGRPARAVRGVLNVPIVYVVALRRRGAAYYTASVPGAVGAAAHPSLRPLGIDPAEHHRPMAAGVQQRILGEVGYRVDTRVYGAQVAVVDGWTAWWGSAHAADALEGHGPVGGSAAEHGPAWDGPGDAGHLVRTAAGARTDGAPVAEASLVTGRPVGLLHATAVVPDGSAVELRWRVGPDGSRLAVRLGRSTATVVATAPGGAGRTLVAARLPRRGRDADRSVQVLDDGRVVAVHVDGRLVGDRWLPVDDLPDPAGGAIALAVEGRATVRDLEAHAREVPLPPDLDCGAPWTPPPSAAGFEERFDATGDLDGATTPSGRRGWRRDEGEGRIELTGAAARVVADRAAPNPGRTIFTVGWEHPSHADLALDMTVPGTGRGQGHNGRAGIVFWQDADNYLVVNVFVDDVFDGASVSTFYRLGGHEVMYDAVWTLVRGVEFGRRCTLRATFDGMRFLASVNGEPALVRALEDVYADARPLRIERVGIIVNREWGDDTGTVLHRFTAGGPAAEG